MSVARRAAALALALLIFAHRRTLVYLTDEIEEYLESAIDVHR